MCGPTFLLCVGVPGEPFSNAFGVLVSSGAFEPEPGGAGELMPTAAIAVLADGAVAFGTAFSVAPPCLLGVATVVGLGAASNVDPGSTGMPSLCAAIDGTASTVPPACGCGVTTGALG